LGWKIGNGGLYVFGQRDANSSPVSFPYGADQINNPGSTPTSYAASPPISTPPAPSSAEDPPGGAAAATAAEQTRALKEADEGTAQKILIDVYATIPK